MTTATHTPTPRDVLIADLARSKGRKDEPLLQLTTPTTKCGADYLTIELAGFRIADAHKSQEPKLRYIQRCVNAHDRLVAALRDLDERFSTDYFDHIVTLEERNRLRLQHIAVGINNARALLAEIDSQPKE